MAQLRKPYKGIWIGRNELRNIANIKNARLTMILSRGVFMKMQDCWKMFISMGSVEGYLLYKMLERQEAQNGGNQDKGSDFKL